MGEVVLALDPGQTTGWAIVRRVDKCVLGMGDLGSAEVGSGIDCLVRGMHRLAYTVLPVVEQMPTPNGVGGHLAVELKFVRQTIDHWLGDVFELDVVYLLPATWKTSRTAAMAVVPTEWRGVALSQHQRDAYTMAHYALRGSRT